MLYYFKKGENATEKQKEMRAVYGEGTETDWTCQKCFAKFRAEDFRLDDAPWSHRAVEVDGDQSETFIENNQCYTTQETADTLKMSKSIKLLMKMKNAFYFTEKSKRNFFWPIQ